MQTFAVAVSRAAPCEETWTGFTILDIKACLTNPGRGAHQTNYVKTEINMTWQVDTHISWWTQNIKLKFKK